RLDVRLDVLQIEERLQESGPDRPHESGAAEQVVQGGRLGADAAGERDRWKVIGVSAVDAQAGGRDLLLDLPYVRAPLEHLRGEARRDVGNVQQLDLGEGAHELRCEDFARRAPGQYRQRRFVLGDQ